VGKGGSYPLIVFGTPEPTQTFGSYDVVLPRPTRPRHNSSGASLHLTSITSQDFLQIYDHGNVSMTRAKIELFLNSTPLCFPLTMRSSLRALPRCGTRIQLQAPISTFCRPLLPLPTARFFSTSPHTGSKTKSPNQKEQEKEDDFDFNNQIDNAIGEAKELQARTPWHREGSDKPPVRRRRSAGAMTKGLFYIILLWVMGEENRLIGHNRQTPHDPLPPPKAHPPPHNPGQKHRQKRHRAPRSPRTSPTTPLIPRTAYTE
jgi:hypothetical protein